MSNKIIFRSLPKFLDSSAKLFFSCVYKFKEQSIINIKA